MVLITQNPDKLMHNIILNIWIFGLLFKIYLYLIYTQFLSYPLLGIIGSS